MRYSLSHTRRANAGKVLLRFRSPVQQARDSPSACHSAVDVDHVLARTQCESSRTRTTAAIIDCCTREIVAWQLELRCRAIEAEQLIVWAAAAHAIEPGELTLGSDNGAPSPPVVSEQR